KNVLLEADLVRPVWRRGAVPGHFPCGPTGLKLGRIFISASPSTSPPLLCQDHPNRQREDQANEPQPVHCVFSGAAAAWLPFALCSPPLISSSSRCASRKRGASSSACNTWRFADGSPRWWSSFASLKCTSAGSGGSSKSSFWQD